MANYRKRGSDVDAFVLTTESGVEFPGWAQELVALDKLRRLTTEMPDGQPKVHFLVDPSSGKGAPMVANPGDWVVRNIKGEVFPMTPEKFADTYEAIE